MKGKDRRLLELGTTISQVTPSEAFTLQSSGAALLDVREPDEVLARWKPFRSHCLRKRRIVTLTMDHEFDGIDAAYFGGWTESGRDKTIPVALKHYLHMDLGSAEESLDLLKKMSKRYFYKLCKTI